MCRHAAWFIGAVAAHIGAKRVVETGATGAAVDPGRFRGSFRWSLAALAAVVVLAVAAPQWVALLGFLAVVIASHEAGHLLVARASGMRPTEFYWGFGPELVSFGAGQCRYGLRALFIGGYVNLVGMTPSAVRPDGFDEAHTYRAASHRGRLATVLAGPAVNLASGALAFVAAALLDGSSVAAALAAGATDPWAVVTGTGQALWIWVTNIGTYLRAVVDPAGAGEVPVRFLSPVAQAEVTGWAVAQGPVTALRWFGILSCAVGAVNLLPLPPLDGAHALAAVVDGIRARVAPDRFRPFDIGALRPVAYVTVVALVVLSVSSLVLDVRDLTP